MIYVEELEKGVTDQQIHDLIVQALEDYKELKKVLVIHPDYTRDDFTDRIVPKLLDELKKRGARECHMLNASGTHRAITREEFLKKLGLKELPEGVYLHNHEFDDPEQLVEVGRLPASFVSEETQGELQDDFPVTVNRLLVEDFDLIIAINGTVPHESTGFSGGFKILVPGVAGPHVVGLFHWAAVLIGIPALIGTITNPARNIINKSCELILSASGARFLSFNMVYSEEEDGIVPRGLYVGEDYEGFLQAYEKACQASSKLHIVYIDEPLDVAVQVIGPHYDEVWTAGKGSYKLQRPGVIKPGGEIIIFAPHIDCFHSNSKMDAAIRQIGYHGKDYVKEFLKKHPDFDRNVAAHVINVRGPAIYDPETGKEEFAFKVTLATAIPKEVCESVNLGYRDPSSLKKEDFEGPGKLWIEHGGKYLYDLKKGV